MSDVPTEVHCHGRKYDYNLNQLKIGIILSYVITILNILVNVIYTPVLMRLLGYSIMKNIAFESILKFVLWVVVYIFVYGVLMWAFGMNVYEKNLMRKALRKFIRRK